MSERDLRNLYENVRRGDTYKSPTRPEDLYYEVMREGQLTMFADPEEAGKNKERMGKGELKDFIKKSNPELKGKALDAEVQRYIDMGYGEEPDTEKTAADQQADFEFDNDTLNILNALDVQSKNRIANLIDKAYTKDIRDTLHPKLSKTDKKGKINVNTLNKAMESLKLSSLPLGTVKMMLKLEYDNESPGGTIINSDIFQSPGYYNISDLFKGDDVTKTIGKDTMAHLRDLGVGAGQAGPYEQAMAVLDKNIHVGAKGDIVYKDVLYEVKAEDGRIGPSEYPGRDKMLKVVHKATEDIIKLHEGETGFPGAIEYFTGKGITYDNIFTFKQQYINPILDSYPTAGLDFISSIVNTLYGNNPGGQPIINAFVKFNDFTSFIHVVIRQLFNMYKSEKAGGAGAWDILLGINAKNGLAVIQTAEDLIPQIGGPISFSGSYSINVVATGTDATRDYMFSFTPQVGL